MVSAGTFRTNVENFVQQNGWGIIMIHAACSGIFQWTFLVNSCTQQYYGQNVSGTRASIYIDSGTVGSPVHGINSPYSDFLLGGLPRSISLKDELYSFRAPPRDSAGVDVLISADESSYTSIYPMGEGNHNMMWTRTMGNGITLFNALGHDDSIYTGTGIVPPFPNFGDTLLWRFIRYVAKDWETVPVPIFKAEVNKPGLNGFSEIGSISISLKELGQREVSIVDIKGKSVFSSSISGPMRMEISVPMQGIYFIKVSGGGHSETRRMIVY